MAKRFDGKLVFVTGASQGIGEAIARAFATEGAAVVLLARNVEKLETLAAELEALGGKGIPHALDLSDFEKCQGAIRAAVASHGVPDVLVNNAGVTADNLILRMKRDEWDRVVATNLTGLFVVTQEIVKGMIRRKSGRIVNMTSVVGLMGNPGQTNYAASKAGVVGFTKSLADQIVMGRLGKPADVASACLFLASDDASYVTGEVLNVSGGLYM